MGYGPATTLCTAHRMRQQPTPARRQRAQLVSTFRNGPSVSPSTFFPSPDGPREPSSSPVLVRTCPWSRVCPAQDTRTRLLCGGVSNLHTAQYMRIDDARCPETERTRRPRVLIHFPRRSSSHALPTLSQHHSSTNERTNDPPPVFPPSAQPWAPIGAYAPTWPVGSSSVSGTASSASAPAPAPQAPCISAASYRISSQPWQPEQARHIRASLIGKRPAVPQPSTNRPIDRRRPDVPSAPARGIDCCCDAPDSSQTEQASPDRTAQVTHAYTHIHVHTHMHGQAEDRGAGSERERKKESPDQPDQQASKHASSKQKRGASGLHVAASVSLLSRCCCRCCCS